MGMASKGALRPEGWCGPHSPDLQGCMGEVGRKSAPQMPFLHVPYLHLPQIHVAPPSSHQLPPFLVAVVRRTSALRESLVRAYLSHTDDKCQEATSQWVENMIRRFCCLVFTLESKEEL